VAPRHGRRTGCGKAPFALVDVSLPSAVSGYRPGPLSAGDRSADTARVRGTSKYAGLAALLSATGAAQIELTFAEVAKVVPDGLPVSAYRYRTWWTSNTDSSAQSRYGWTPAGYRVSQVDLTNGLVIFTRADCPSQPAVARPGGWRA
jgi:hypothetical protein